MIRIKDNIDLDILVEKYGFVFSDELICNKNFKLIIYRGYYKKYSNCDNYYTYINLETRYFVQNIYDYDTLFDLIADGLVEKV